MLSGGLAEELQKLSDELKELEQQKARAELEYRTRHSSVASVHFQMGYEAFAEGRLKYRYSNGLFDVPNEEFEAATEFEKLRKNIDQKLKEISEKISSLKQS